MFPVSAIVGCILAGTPATFPSPYDAHGWAFRVRCLGSTGPYLVGEKCDRIKVEITLTNKTAGPLAYPPLDAALKASELQITVNNRVGPGGLRAHFDSDPPTRAGTWRRMKAGESVSIEFSLADFGYEKFWYTGRFLARPVFQTPQGKVSAVPWFVEAVEATEDMILVSHALLPIEREAKLPADAQHRGVVQQIKLANKVYLFYRKFEPKKSGSQTYVTARLAELPEKCEMQVNGSVGDELITITYQHSPTGTTKLTVGSKTGAFSKEIIEK